MAGSFAGMAVEPFVIGPLIGGPIGAALYDALIGRHLPVDDEDAEPGRTPNDPDVERADDTAHGRPAGASTEQRTQSRG